MNDDKRSKMFGEPVSKEEVLYALGHPSEWFALSRVSAFRNRLVRGQDDLDIGGIRGCGRMTGYLDFLRTELTRPIGTGTGLVPPEVDAQILSALQAEISAEIAKYETRLAELERSPAAVEDHLERMRSRLDMFENNMLFAEQDPSLEPLEELQEMVRDSNRKRIQEIEQLRADIEKYDALLGTLS